MDALKAALIGGDPVAREGGLSAAEADRIRRVLVAAAETARESAFWPRPLFVAATVAATVIVGVVFGRALPRFEPRTPAPTAVAAPAEPTLHLAERRQLQFATPGGTRIIWVFDPEFNP